MSAAGVCALQRARSPGRVERVVRRDPSAVPDVGRCGRRDTLRAESAARAWHAVDWILPPRDLRVPGSRRGGSARRDTRPGSGPADRQRDSSTPLRDRRGRIDRARSSRIEIRPCGRSRGTYLCVCHVQSAAASARMGCLVRRRASSRHDGFGCISGREPMEAPRGSALRCQASHALRRGRTNRRRSGEAVCGGDAGLDRQRPEARLPCRGDVVHRASQRTVRGSGSARGHRISRTRLNEQREPGSIAWRRTRLCMRRVGLNRTRRSEGLEV